MIFQKRPRKSVDINFNIGTEPIEIVQEYTYLGTRLTPTGNFWRHSLEHSKKLEFYKVFKDEYFTSDCLNQLRNFNERRNLVKFRVSNHNLMIQN